jgi:hypothetical protein
MRNLFTILALALGVLSADAGDWLTLFDGKNLDAFEFAENSWFIDDEGAVTCRMTVTETKKGKKKRGMGNIWSKADYSDFELAIEYKMSEGANSGVFYRADPKNSTQGGLEIQLMHNEGFQKTHGKKDERKLNGTFYDCKPAASDPSKPIGQWNTLVLTCKGPMIKLSINDVQTFSVNIDDWTEPGKNPDGTTNKFKKAMKDFPRKGRIGFQNHGQEVWFRNVKIRTLE